MKKLKLRTLELKSFVTDLNRTNLYTVKGGSDESDLTFVYNEYVEEDFSSIFSSTCGSKHCEVIPPPPGE